MSLAADQVREFHEKYKVPIRDTPNADVPERALRLDLIQEEFHELRQALGIIIQWSDTFGYEYHLVKEPDIVEVADALGDLLYVIYGAALTFGIDLDAVVTEIHLSNMSKLGADGLPIVREDGKVLKGPGFFKPDLARVLGLETDEQ